MSSEESPTVNQPTFWEQRYRTRQDHWDLGEPAPTFVRLLDAGLAPPLGTVAVPGCGRGYDALLFARRGYQVCGFDFAADAIADATRLALRSGESITFLQLDLFALPPEFDGLFDVVVEHTCFCAIDPSRRTDYIEVVHRLLKPGGELLAIFFTHANPGGPPYRTDRTEIEQLFSPYFQIREIGPAFSVPGRAGEELFARLVRQ